MRQAAGSIGAAIQTQCVFQSAVAPFRARSHLACVEADTRSSEWRCLRQRLLFDSRAA